MRIVKTGKKPGDKGDGEARGVGMNTAADCNLSRKNNGVE